MVTRLSPNPLKPFSLVALASLFVSGVTWLILTNSKKSRNFGYGTHGRSKQNFVSPEYFLEGCNVFEGKWVLDNKTYPLYQEINCPYLIGYSSCQRTGRPDTLYQNWKWQPKHCNMPRFDPLELLNMLRGKKIMFIGDSVGRNHFDSLICMVQSSIPEGKKSFTKFPPSLTVFEMEEYNASMNFYWAPFIVESISDDADNHTVTSRFLYLDSIEEHGENWKGVDILVFDTYAWWFFRPTVSAQYHGNSRHYNWDEAYRLGLGTWANWMDNNINPRKQQVYFTSLSPAHWGALGDENCFNDTLPNPALDWRTDINLKIMKITKDVLQKTRTKVTLLNITQLSESRIDAHPTVYGEHKGKPLTKEQRATPKKYSDCLHWCLPGVPDAWNEILYTYLFMNHLKSFFE